MATIASRLAVKQKKLEQLGAKMENDKRRYDKLLSEIKELQLTAIQQKMAEYDIPFNQVDAFLDSLNPKNAKDPNQIDLFQTGEGDTEESSEKGGESK